ncbi:hypothetical protein INT43_001502 [Umbelopsis isabellina]|uniref:Transcription initiation factor TFIID subunit 4 n=1 Tax=Mortierella isabellina TaxID=91625 RepID=A0A8H7U7R8_MORIS|nr:hypothetical protein INT43_001502 [Umbelopsis isabellina]
MSDKSGGKPIPTNLADFDFSNIPSDIQSILDDTTFPDSGSHGTGQSFESITQDMLQQGDAMSINDLLGGHHTPNMQNQPMSGNGSTGFTDQSNASSAMQSPASDGSGGRMPNTNRQMLSSSPIVSSPMVKNEDALSPHSGVSMSPSPSPSRIGTAVLTPRPSTPNVGTGEGTPEINPADAYSIKARLPPERRAKWEELFEKLKTGRMTANDFLSESQLLLGSQQYQQLQDLKNRPAAPQQPQQPQQQQQSQQIRMQASNGMGDNTDANGRKRAGINPDTPPQFAQTKRFKSENTQPGVVMGPPSGTATPYRPNSQITTPTIPGVQTPRPAGTPGRPPLANTGASNTQDERVDYDTLTDVMGYAGVDLKEETEQSLIHGDTGAAPADGVDRTKMQHFINMTMLKVIVSKIAGKSAVSDINPDFLAYLALATQDRLSGLVEQMVKASKHRVLSQTFDAPPIDEATGQPLYKIIVQQDTRKQLLAIERVEREEERRRKEAISEKERRAQQGDGGGDDDDKPKKKKQKAMGPGVTARTMSEDMRNKKANETALMSAGGKRMSWMMSAANDAPSPPAKSFTPTTQTPPDSEPAAPKTKGKRGRPRGSGASGRAGTTRADSNSNVNLFLPPSTVTRPLRAGDASSRKITVRDAIFALERERDNGIGTSAEERILLKVYSKLLK